MAQVPCVFRQAGQTLDYTPGSAVAAGSVVLIGTTIVGIVPVEILGTEKGALAVSGVWNVPKDNSDVSAGDALYWASGGTPVGGTAVGAFTKTSGGNVFAGYAIEAAGTGVADVDLFLRSIDGTIPGTLSPVSTSTVVANGTTIVNGAQIGGYGFCLVTNADNTAAVILPTAVAGAVVIIKSFVATAILKVFPSVNDSINLAAANAVYNQANGALRMYCAYNAVAWFTDPETPT